MFLHAEMMVCSESTNNLVTGAVIIIIIRVRPISTILLQKDSKVLLLLLRCCFLCHATPAEPRVATISAGIDDNDLQYGNIIAS